jgi:hypothetical protein
MNKMAYFVCVVGALTAAWAITIQFKPDWMKRSIAFIKKGRLVYIVATCKIFIGIIFLIVSTYCRRPWAVIVIGILMTGGVSLFSMQPLEKIKAYLDWWLVRPVWMYRLWSVAAILFGALLIWAGMPK